MTALAPLVQTGEANSWVVRVGDNVPAFLFANGPARIVRYNFNVVKERQEPHYVHRRQVGAQSSYGDIFELTRVAGTRSRSYRA